MQRQWDPGNRSRFFITFSAFVVLGVTFKVMVLVEGLTEIRPVNAIPQVAGLLAGPVGAAACWIGNLVSDLAGTLSFRSILGMIANFIAAYLPYRLWHSFSNEEPNVHSGKNMLLYCMIAFVTAMTAAWILAFGLYVFFDAWMPEIYQYVFFNNFGFSVGLGMPLLILFTSDAICIKCQPRPQKQRLLHSKYVRFMISAAYLLLMLILLGGIVFAGHSPVHERYLRIASVAALPCLICFFI